MDADEAEPVADEMEALLREANDELEAINRLADHIGRFMTDAAFHEFPSLQNMNAEQIRAFGDAVSRASTNFAMRAAELSET